jgi:hypothetical protein
MPRQTFFHTAEMLSSSWRALGEQQHTGAPVGEVVAEAKSDGAGSLLAWKSLQERGTAADARLRKEELARAAEAERPRGRLSGRAVDGLFLAAARAVKAGTFEGGAWHAWQEVKERLRHRDQVLQGGEPAGERRGGAVAPRVRCRLCGTITQGPKPECFGFSEGGEVPGHW